MKRETPRQGRISLAPLKFEEAITDLLKIKPMPKPPKTEKAKAKLKAQSPRKPKRSR